MLGFLLQLQFSVLYVYFHSHKALLVFGGITFLLPLYMYHKCRIVFILLSISWYMIKHNCARKIVWLEILITI